MVGGAGLATDTIQWTLWKRQLQRMADSAALAGALANANGASATTNAQAEINRYNLLTLYGSPVIETPPTVGPYSGNGKAVRVSLATSNALPFSSMFMAQTPIIGAQATAAAVSFGTFCVLSLETTTATGITFQGSATTNLGCGIATNSQGTYAVSAGGSSTITASPVAAVGGIPASNNYAAGTVFNSYSIAQPDPYSALPAASTLANSCSGQLSVGPNNTRRINNNSGITCYRGMDLKGNVTFDSGVYVIDGSTGGTLNIGSQAVINGSGVTFILTTSDGNASNIATVNMNGTATLNITAPDSGTYEGMLIYQDRNAILGPNNYITGNSSSLLRGAIYMPGQDVQFTGNSGMDTNCLQIVARRVTFTGNSTITNVCPSGGSHGITGIQIRLVN